MKDAQQILIESYVYDSFADLQSSIEWLEEDTCLDELRNRVKVAIDEAEALLEGLHEASNNLGSPWPRNSA